MTGPAKGIAFIRIAAWIFMLIAWLGQAMAAKNPLDADCVSYLDMAYASLNGNWHALVNGYWSPGYSFLLAAWIKLFKVMPAKESLAVHLFSVASLVFALFCLEFFLSAFFESQRWRVDLTGEDYSSLLDEYSLRFLAYVLFFWIATFLTPPYLEQPDILIFALYLLGAGLCLRIAGKERNLAACALLGVVLGLGYLTKAVMFPLAFAFLTSLLLRKDWPRAIPGVVLAIAVFLAIGAPYIFVLSKSKGRLTYGDVGAVNYRHIMGFDIEETNATNSPLPTAAPHAREFKRTLFLGTYPPWADPSYDYHGAPLRFDLHRQLGRIHVVLRTYFDLYVWQLGALVTGLLVLLLLGNRYKDFVSRFFAFNVLWLPAIAGLSLYSLVRAEGRMLAGFTMVLFASIAGSLSFEREEWSRGIHRGVALAVCVVMLSQIAVQIGHHGFSFSSKRDDPDWRVAEALGQMGLQAGDRAAYLGDTLVDHAWAHLARVRISAEIPAEDELNFWAANESRREEALQWLRESGAKVLVTRRVPPSAMSMGWTRVSETEYFLLALDGRVAMVGASL